MAESAVVNASSLISLTRRTHRSTATNFCEVIVPESVATEIEVRGKRDPTAQALANTSWLVVTQTPQSQLKSKPWD